MGVKPTTCPKCTHTKPDEEVILEIWDSRIKEMAQKIIHDFRLDQDLAQDLAQEARLRVVLAARAGRPLTPGYVATVARNAIWTALGRERRRPAPAIPIPQDEMIRDGKLMVEPSVNDPDPLLSSWIRTLPERLQVIYRLLVVEEWTQEEVGIRLGLSQARVSQLKLELVRGGLARRRRSP